MNFLRWLSALLQPKPVKYVKASDWAADHFPVEQREIAARVAEVLADSLNISFDELDRATRFMKDLLMDDLEPMEFLQALEHTFRISIPVGDTASLETISDLVLYLHSRLGTHG